MVRLPCSFAALALVACAVEPPLEPATLADVCGMPGPFHLLQLAADERLVAGHASFVASGDRLVFVTGTGQAGMSLEVGPYPRDTTVYSVGACGEDPVVVARDIQQVFTDPLWPGLVFACTPGTLDLVRLDPSGAEQPQLVATGACGSRFTPLGLLRYDIVGNDRLSVQHYRGLAPDTPVYGEPQLLFPHVPLVNSYQTSVRLLSEDVFRVDADGDLVRHHLLDHTETREQSNVAVFTISDDARWMLYQVTPVTGPAHDPIGALYLRDRVAGVTVPIGTGMLTQSYFRTVDVVIVALTDPSPHQILISLPDLETTEVPAGHRALGPIADGRWLTMADGWYLLDLGTGQTTLVSGNRGQPLAYADDHLDLLTTPMYSARISARLLRFPYDGGDAFQLAPRVNLQATVLADDRVVTMLDVDDSFLGDLVVVDPTTQQEQRIDDHVIAGTDLDDWQLPGDPGTLVYGVVDGDRTGVWLARPADP